MRKSSDILIYIDVQKAIDAGINFYMSANGVVLTEGDDRGYLKPEFFSRVESVKGTPLPGYDGPQGVTPKVSAPMKASAVIAAEDTPKDSKDEVVLTSLQEVEKKLESTNL